MYKHPRQEVEAYPLPPSESNSVGKLRYVPVNNSRKRYCMLEPSSSPDSTVLVSNNNNNNSGYEDTSASCVTDDFNDKIKELETAMMGPDSSDLPLYYNDSFASTSSQETNSWRSTLEAVSRRDLRADLVSCAKAMSENDLMMANSMMEKLRLMVSVSGEPIQRLGAYLLEGLVAQLASSGGEFCFPARSYLLRKFHRFTGKLMTFKESEYGYARKVSGPVVVADGMAGAAMYELSSRTFLSILASTLKLLSSSEEIVSGDNSKIIPCLWISRMERPTVGI